MRLLVGARSAPGWRGVERWDSAANLAGSAASHERRGAAWASGDGKRGGARPGGGHGGQTATAGYFPRRSFTAAGGMVSSGGGLPCEPTTYALMSVLVPQPTLQNADQLLANITRIPSGEGTACTSQR